jgi:hypothetical protein
MSFSSLATGPAAVTPHDKTQLLNAQNIMRGKLIFYGCLRTEVNILLSA